MKTTLYVHQEAAFNAAFNKKFFALFMEMGTGKTITSLALFEKMGVSRMLVVCPKALMNSWELEIDKHTHFNIVLKWQSNKIKGKRYQQRISSFLNDSDKKIMIVNIEAFSTKNASLEKLLKAYEADMGVLDESSKIKNPKAKRTKRLIKLTGRISHKYILTGTEITNSPLDIYAQFDFLNQAFWCFKNFYHFRARYANLEERYGIEGRTYKVITGFKRVHELLAKIEPHCYRIKKADCLDLPEKIYREVPIELTKEQRRFYDYLKNNLWAEYNGQVLTVQQKSVLFMRFRQIAGGFLPERGELIGDRMPKLEVILEEQEDQNNKIIIWSCFTAEIEAIAKQLQGVSVTYYGALSNDQKTNNLYYFKNDPQTKYLIINPMSGAYGLNLQHSSISYWYSRPLSPEQNMQAEDRQHRIGQTNNVVYTDLPALGTIDMHILKLLRNKKDMVQAFQDMTIDDIFSVI